MRKLRQPHDDVPDEAGVMILGGASSTATRMPESLSAMALSMYSPSATMIETPERTQRERDAELTCGRCGQVIQPGDAVAGRPERMLHLRCWLDEGETRRAAVTLRV